MIQKHDFKILQQSQKAIHNREIQHERRDWLSVAITMQSKKKNMKKLVASKRAWQKTERNRKNWETENQIFVDMKSWDKSIYFEIFDSMINHRTN